MRESGDGSAPATNTPDMMPTTRKRFMAGAMLLAAGLIVLPIIVYTFGQTVIGPYEGASGFAGFIGSIYAGVLSGQMEALLLVSSPALLFAIWYFLPRTRHHPPGPMADRHNV